MQSNNNSMQHLQWYIEMVFILIQQGRGQILKKNQQLVRWHGRFHSTSTLLWSRFHAISCVVPIQSPALAAKNFFLNPKNPHLWFRHFLLTLLVHWDVSSDPPTTWFFKPCMPWLVFQYMIRFLLFVYNFFEKIEDLKPFLVYTN